MDAKRLGFRIKKFREEAGLSQQEMAEALGISFQQLQKYEYGDTRLTVERLLKMSQILHVPLNQLIPPNEAADGRYSISAESEVFAPYERVIISPEEFKLLKSYRKIQNDHMRTIISRHVKDLADFDKKIRG